MPDNFQQFIERALVTESREWQEIMPRLCDIRTLRLLHAAMGLTTEAVEFLDALKKWIFYGKPIDNVNLAEEIGDSEWYKAIAIDALGNISLEEIHNAVIDKLQQRYKGEFNSKGAINRNLSDERSTLERSLNDNKI
jgi:NTP pyrophosphatase (non-canonical NTP hydrolase)